MCPEQDCPQKVCPEQDCPQKVCPEQDCPQKVCPKRMRSLSCFVVSHMKWTQVKFLVDRNGQAVKRYKPGFDPLELEGDVSTFSPDIRFLMGRGEGRGDMSVLSSNCCEAGREGGQRDRLQLWLRPAGAGGRHENFFVSYCCAGRKREG